MRVLIGADHENDRVALHQSEIHPSAKPPAIDRGVDQHVHRLMSSRHLAVDYERDPLESYPTQDLVVWFEDPKAVGNFRLILAEVITPAQIGTVVPGGQSR